MNERVQMEDIVRMMVRFENGDEYFLSHTHNFFICELCNRIENEKNEVYLKRFKDYQEYWEWYIKLRYEYTREHVNARLCTSREQTGESHNNTL